MSSSVATRPPRFNHLAMSVPADLLGEGGRADLVAFYSEVFGFAELPTMTQDRRRLVFGCYTIEQFVFLVAGDDPPMSCPRTDHYGFSVGTVAELDAILARATAFRERDARVDIVDKHVDDHGPLAITSIYIGYLLPMMVEIQWWDFKQDAVESEVIPKPSG